MNNIGVAYWFNRSYLVIHAAVDCAAIHTCGALLGAMFKKYDKIVEFTAFEDFISLDKKCKNKVKRTENHKIKVTIEVDMVCGAVN